MCQLEGTSRTDSSQASWQLGEGRTGDSGPGRERGVKKGTLEDSLPSAYAVCTTEANVSASKLGGQRVPHNATASDEGLTIY